MPRSEREAAIIDAIRKGLNSHASSDAIAASLGYRPPRNGRLAVSKTLRSMEARGLVGRIPPADRWDSAIWFIRIERPTDAPE